MDNEEVARFIGNAEGRIISLEHRAAEGATKSDIDRVSKDVDGVGNLVRDMSGKLTTFKAEVRAEIAEIKSQQTTNKTQIGMLIVLAGALLTGVWEYVRRRVLA